MRLKIRNSQGALSREPLEEVAGFCEEGLRDIPTLLACGRDDGAKAGEGVGAGHGAETAGYFHLDLHHPQVLLGQIVGEGNGEVIDEAQDIGFELMQSPQAIVSWPVRDRAARSPPSAHRLLLPLQSAPPPP